MTSISSINSLQAGAISTYKTEELSSTTKLKLEALGIDPSMVTTEAQAQTLIAQAEAAKQQNNAGQQQQGGNSSEQELLSEAKNLATEVGVTVSSSDSLDDIIDNISKEIQVMLNSGDQSKVSSAQGYQAQLASISGRAEAIQSTQQNIFNAMDMISVSNKYALGL